MGNWHGSVFTNITVFHLALHQSQSFLNLIPNHFLVPFLLSAASAELSTHSRAALPHLGVCSSSPCLSRLNESRQSSMMWSLITASLLNGISNNRAGKRFRVTLRQTSRQDALCHPGRLNTSSEAESHTFYTRKSQLCTQDKPPNNAGCHSNQTPLHQLIGVSSLVN